MTVVSAAIPQEIIKMILEYVVGSNHSLHALSLTSKTVREILVSLVFRDVELSNNALQFEIYLMHAHYIRSIYILGKSMDEQMMEIIVNSRQLRSLTVRDIVFQKGAVKFGATTRLDPDNQLEYLSIVNETMDVNGYHSILNAFTGIRLKYLEFGVLEFPSMAILKDSQMGESCYEISANLQSLIRRNMDLETVHIFGVFITKGLLETIAALPRLRKLSMCIVELVYVDADKIYELINRRKDGAQVEIYIECFHAHSK